MYTSRNGVCSRILPLATLFIAQPPARQRRVLPGPLVQRAEHVEGRLLEHDLQRGRDRLVPRLDRILRAARRAEQRLELRREDRPIVGSPSSHVI